MNPTEVLMNEHRLIESVLGALESYADRLGSDPVADPADLARFAAFLETFADSCHHGKEEEIFYDALVRQGMPIGSGPIAVMLHGHEEGRRLVRTMRELAARSASPGWAEEDLSSIRRAARDYAALLRDHIAKEDDILFPMAASRLDEPTMAEIGRRFEAFEEEKMGPGEHEKLHALAEELITLYGGSGDGAYRRSCSHSSH